jgi:hypothetical protein
VSFREDLASGNLGLRWSLPDAFEPMEEAVVEDLVSEANPALACRVDP